MNRGVYSTPTFIIGNKLYPGMRNYDEMKKLVDSLAKTTTPAVATASSTAPAPKK